MFQWLVVAAVIAVVTSEPAAEQAAEALSIHDVYNDRYDDRSGLRERGGMRDAGRDHGDQDRYDGRDDRRDGERNGPHIVKLVDPGNIANGHYNAREKEIIMNAYSPDYYEPTWILDYRYLKTGGRDYTRSDGGQIMILPKNVYSKEQKEHKNFDELLEFLRLKQLSEAEAFRLHGEKRHQEDRDGRRPESYASAEREGRGEAYGSRKDRVNWAGLNGDH